MYLYMNCKYFSPLSTTSSDEHEVPQFLPGSVDATAAVYYCKFCSKLLDGRAKMLKCLHAICDECIGGKMIGPGNLIVLNTFYWSC